MVYLSPQMTSNLAKLASTSPTLQRLTIGATGLVMQTTIDATNPNVDESTRKYSAIRTAVKMVVTTVGGITFREIGQKLIGEQLVNKGILEVPKELVTRYAKLPAAERLREYCDFLNKDITKVKKAISPEILAKAKFAGAVGWVCAVGVAILSVFIFDMPFVNKAMNFVLDKIFDKDKH